MNVERLERSGSGYVGRHEPDMLFAADPWFRGIDLGYGPDGGVFVLDWSDTGECHERNGVHRSSGRIYKITYGTPAPRSPSRDLSRLDERDLVDLQRHPNEWFVRQARRVAGRPAAARATGSTRRRAALLRPARAARPTRSRKLRALWSLHAIGAADAGCCSGAARSRARGGPRLGDPPADRRAAARHDLQPARRAATCEPAGGPARDELARHGAGGPLGPGPPGAGLDAPAAARGAAGRAGRRRSLAHAEDAADHNVPLLLWYGLIPLGRLRSVGARAARGGLSRCRRRAG